MPWSVLTSAAIVSAVHLLLLWPAVGSTWGRESALVVVSGDVAVACLVMLALGGWARLRGAPLDAGRASLLGVAIALGPLVGHAAESPRAGMLTVLAVGCVAWLLGPRLRVPRILGVVGIVGALVVAAVLSLGLTAPSITPALPEPPPDAPVADGEPDLVLISIDTLRADRFTPRTMPWLTKRAASGITTAYGLADADHTLPSHVSLLSGRPVAEHRVWHNDYRVDPALPLIQERLQDAGWRTAAVISNAVLHRESGLARGFEVYDESPMVSGGPIATFRKRIERHTWWGWLRLVRHLPPPVESRLYGWPRAGGGGHVDNASRTTRRAVELVEQLQDDRAPYFLFVHYMDPHTPYCPGPSTHGTFMTDGTRRATASWSTMDALGSRLSQGPAEVQEEEQAELDWALDLYDEEVLAVDHAVRTLVETIDAGNRPTLFAVVSDHGEQFGDHDKVMHGTSLFEPALRVPVALFGTTVPTRIEPTPPTLMDVTATLLAAVGLSDPDSRGVDLRAGSPTPSHIAMRRPLCAVREGPWKLIGRVTESAEGPRLVATHLFNLEVDEAERSNRLMSETGIANPLHRMAEEALRAPSRYAPQADDSPEQRARLKALGYVDE